MGLDIVVYEELKFVRDIPRRRLTDADYETELIIIPSQKFFPGRCNLQPGFYRSIGRKDRFRAGSYSGYNSWRDELARLAGHPNAEAYWNGNGDDNWPFYPLIDFSDCDGILGPEVCTRLARDFKGWNAKARKHQPASWGPEASWFYEQYQKWQSAFVLAQGKGIVVFC